MTHTHTTAGRNTIRVTVIALLAAVSMALLPAVADAHRLSAKKARQIRDAGAQQLAAQLDGQRFTDSAGNGITLQVENALVGPCTRRTAHKFTCPIGAEGVAVFDDGYTERFQCDSLATVKFRSRRSRQVRGSYTEPACGPQAASSRDLSGRTGGKAYQPAG